MKKVLVYLFAVLIIISCEDPVEEPNATPQEGTLFYCSKIMTNAPWQLFSKDLSTDVVTPLIDDPLNNYWWVTVSPDKKQLLLLRSPVSSPTDQFDYENCEMIRCDADGANQVVIIADNQYDWFAFGNPHWHPNGDRILMIAQMSNATAPFYTYTVDIDGTNPKQLIDQYSIDAHWNKAGDKVTFIGIDEAGFVDATSFEVFVADYDYTDNELSSISQLTSDDTRNHDPCFSPDGSQIAFSASNALLLNADLVTMDLDGGNRRDLINDNGIHGGPLNWGADDRIYHHSIYIGTTNFTVGAYNTSSESNEILLRSIVESYISPYYVE